MSTAPAAATTMPPSSAKPAIGKAVLVTYFDPKHEVKSQVAHVLSIGTLATELATEDGHPSLTLAFPSDSADPAKLGSPRWNDAYQRVSGVVHYTHPLARAGKVSVVWGYPVEVDVLPTLLTPEGNAENPIFERQELHELEPPTDLSQTVAVQSGKAPEGTVISPLTSDAGLPTAADLDANAREQSTKESTTTEAGNAEAPTTS